MTFVERLRKYSMTRAGGLTETSIMESLETLAEGLDEVFYHNGPREDQDVESAHYEALKGFNSLLLALEKATNLL